MRAAQFSSQLVTVTPQVGEPSQLRYGDGFKTPPSRIRPCRSPSGRQAFLQCDRKPTLVVKVFRGPPPVDAHVERFPGTASGDARSYLYRVSETSLHIPGKRPSPLTLLLCSADS